MMSRDALENNVILLLIIEELEASAAAALTVVPAKENAIRVRRKRQIS